MSTLGHDANAFTNRLQQMRTAGARIDLAGLLGETSSNDDRLVADWIRSYGDVVRSEALGVRLQEFVNAAPWLLDSEEALDAAIEVCLDSAAARHESLDAAAAGMIRDYPGIAPAIRRAVLLHVSLHPSEDGAMPTGAAVFTLPHDFGVPGPGGRTRYELRGLIGVGGQGVVYSAIDRLFSEPQAPTYVAVKVFHGTGAGMKGSHDSAARGEAIRAARIAHQGVVRALDHGVDQQTHAYATFELVEGRPLDQWLERREQFDMKTAVRLMISVAEAVEAAHAFGVVHRDLKPSNILIARDDQPRVTDFGIGRATGLPLDSRGRYTSRGSLAFMSPEHYAGRPESDAPTSDIYCLGGLLYWIMTGKLPNGHDIASAVRHLEHDAAPPRSYPARVPATLRSICERALSHSPKHRHHSAGAFAEDLRAWLGHRPLTWTAPRPTTRAHLFIRRNRAGAIATAAAVLTLMGAAGWVAATVQNANNDAAIQEERLAQAELASQLAISNERVVAQHEKITQANRMIRAWKDAIVQSGIMDPARYLSLLAVLGSSSLTEETLKSDILLDSLDASIQIADQAWTSDPDSLESWLWQLIAGVNLDNADRADEGRIYLERARDGLATVLAPDDPLLVRLQEHLGEERSPAMAGPGI